MSVMVEPREGSYVTEWEAVQFDGENLTAVRGILRHSPWTMHLDLTDNGAFIMCSQMIGGLLQQWKTGPGDWIVKTPHGRFWFMSDGEFQSQFMVTA